MIETINIQLVDGISATDDWCCTLEIPANASLEDLHFAIQNAVGFEADHLYCFYAAKSAHSKDRLIFDDDNEAIYSLPLSDLFPLDDRRQLYYLFDFGDRWLFKLNKSRKKPFGALAGIHYPRVIVEQGDRPEQYPDWHDEEEGEFEASRIVRM
jgi:hypothetical protein